MVLNSVSIEIWQPDSSTIISSCARRINAFYLSTLRALVLALCLCYWVFPSFSSDLSRSKEAWDSGPRYVLRKRAAESRSGKTKGEMCISVDGHNAISFSPVVFVLLVLEIQLSCDLGKPFYIAHYPCYHGDYLGRRSGRWIWLACRLVRNSRSTSGIKSM